MVVGVVAVFCYVGDVLRSGITHSTTVARGNLEGGQQRLSVLNDLIHARTKDWDVGKSTGSIGLSHRMFV
jgi:hypothetical protein